MPSCSEDTGCKLVPERGRQAGTLKCGGAQEKCRIGEISRGGREGGGYRKAASCDIGQLQSRGDGGGVELELQEGNHHEAGDDGRHLCHCLQLLLPLLLWQSVRPIRAVIFVNLALIWPENELGPDLIRP